MHSDESEELWPGAQLTQLAAHALRAAWQHAATLDAQAEPRTRREALGAAERACALMQGIVDEPPESWACAPRRALAVVSPCIALLRELQGAPEPAIAGNWRRMKTDLAGLCLNLVSACLGHCEAADLAAHASDIRRLLGELQAAVLDIEDPELTARWFLHTQGLRAQRMALRQLPAAGERLPRLGLADLQARLQPRSAIVMVARSPDQRLGFALLLRDGQGALLQRQIVVPVPDGASADGVEDIQLIDHTLHHALPTAVRKAPGDEDGPFDQLPMHERQALHDAARARMDALAEAAMRVVRKVAGKAADIGFVPSGDLHALPWQHHFSTGLPATVRVRLYVSAADWWRLHETQPPRRPARTPSPMPRWAMVAYDASDTGDLSDRLYWVRAEADMSRRLWSASGIEALDLAGDAPMPATALLACGHGFAPGDDVSRAGVWVGTVRSAAGDGTGSARRPTLLDAQALSRMPTLARVVLSCCVLGRTEDILGEPLGLMAQVFSHGVRFALGALVRVGDLEAALFSIAFQWSLRSACTRPSMQSHVDWVEVFQSLQACIRAGHWPTGFGSWLEAELPRTLQSVVPSVAMARDDEDAFHARNGWHRLLGALSAELGANGAMPRPSQPWLALYETLARELARRPPEHLRRVAPWMVALGT